MTGKNLLIVSIDSYSMEVLQKKGFYATKRQIKEGVKWIAFYQVKPIQSITHYGEIDSIEQCGIDEVGTIYWLRNFPDQSPPYNVIKFKKLKKMNKKIIKDVKMGIQGPVLFSLDKLKKINFLSEVFSK